MYPLLGTVIRKKDDPKLSFYQARQGLPSYYHHVNWFLGAKARLNLPETVIDAAIGYLSRLEPKRSLVGPYCIKEAALFLSCRVHGVSRKADEIAELSSNSLATPQRVVTKAYEIADALGVEVRPDDPNRLFFNAVEKLGLPRKLYNSVLDVLPKLEHEFPSGHMKLTNAAALLWMMANREGHRCKQQDIASALGISEGTVRMRVLDIRQTGILR